MGHSHMMAKVIGQSNTGKEKWGPARRARGNENRLQVYKKAGQQVDVLSRLKNLLPLLKRANLVSLIKRKG